MCSSDLAQVNSLLLEKHHLLEVITVLIDPTSKLNTVLDSGTEKQVKLDSNQNAFRATPAI